ncbi:hypothetical protein, partial [Limosilactobacillus reuteri]|uniref:hypothetical protein n=1 Tax=Limosilactobacillus reuteri TaxID=1598 RepID=UPI003C12B997
LNLTKLGQSISRLETNFINNLKSGLRFLNQSKIVVRILLLENQKLIVNSQPRLFISFLIRAMIFYYIDVGGIHYKIEKSQGQC